MKGTTTSGSAGDQGKAIKSVAAVKRRIVEPANNGPITLRESADGNHGAAATLREGFQESVRGLGLVSTQLNDFRLYLPVELRRRLGALLEGPWIISFWCEGCLRVVPRDLWPGYLERLRQGIERLSSVDWIDEAVVQPAAAISLEHGGRWHLPHSLAELSRIDGGSLCLLCPTPDGIEIWDATIKQERLRTIVRKVDHKGGPADAALRRSILGVPQTPPLRATPDSRSPLRGVDGAR